MQVPKLAFYDVDWCPFASHFLLLTKQRVEINLEVVFPLVNNSMIYIFVIKVLRLTLKTIQRPKWMLLNFFNLRHYILIHFLALPTYTQCTTLYDRFDCPRPTLHFVEAKQGELFTSGIWIVATVDYKYILGSWSTFNNHLVFRPTPLSGCFLSRQYCLAVKKGTPSKMIYTHFIVLPLLL